MLELNSMIELSSMIEASFSFVNIENCLSKKNLFLKTVCYLNFIYSSSSKLSRII